MTEYSSGCLAVFTHDEFLRVANNIRSQSQNGASERYMTMSFFSGAVDVQPDKQGRIAIPPHLREYAQLDGEILLAGHFDHIEIWNIENFHTKRGVGTAMLQGEEGIAVFSPS